MNKDLDRVKLLALDLRNGKQFPRSPRAMLGGYVLAARAVDKCRSDLAGMIGEYHTDCPLDKIWMNFAEIKYADLRAYVATGASDDDVSAWIINHAKKRTPAEIAVWNNGERDKRLSDLPPETQAYFEGYIQKFVPRHRVVYTRFDIFDLEEQRL